MQGALAPVDTCERVRGGAHGEMPGGARRAALGGAVASGAPPRGGFRRHVCFCFAGSPAPCRRTHRRASAVPCGAGRRDRFARRFNWIGTDLRG